MFIQKNLSYIKAKREIGDFQIRKVGSYERDSQITMPFQRGSTLDEDFEREFGSQQMKEEKSLPKVTKIEIKKTIFQETKQHIKNEYSTPASYRNLDRKPPKTILLRSHIKDCEIIELYYEDKVLEQISKSQSRNYTDKRAKVKLFLCLDSNQKKEIIDEKKRKMNSRKVIILDD